jgi:hypothetical protein
MPVFPFNQNDFSGGMNLLNNDTNIAINQYARAENIRNRDDGLIAINDKEEDTTAPSGKKQGIFAYEDLVVLFCGGRAYFKNILTSSPWTQIANFALDPTIDYIYTEPVPISTFNFERKLQENTQINGTDLNTVIDLTNIEINGTAAALVCQDGLNPPWKILPNGTASQIQTFEQWTKSNREYVPIMRQMKYFAGILFGIAQDGIRLFRSVSGRPLDFVVNVKIDGDKGGAADTTAYSPGTNKITCLAALKTGELFLGTKRTCHPLDLNFSKTIFAEPTFNNTKTFAAGIVNNFSFLDILTDYTMIDTDGIRSWNAIFMQENEGRNSLFSRMISKSLNNIIQGAATSAAILFDNYAIFSINTTFGYRLAIFDINSQLWVCFDDFGIGAIKQFAIADQSEFPKLYAITDTKVYTLYSSSSRARARVFTRAADSGMPQIGTKLTNVFLNFDASTVTDNPSVTPIVDNVEAATDFTRPIEIGGVSPLKYNLQGNVFQGKKVQAELSWQNDGKLTQLSLEVETKSPNTPFRQTNESFS